jgi:branched-chain amino acid transport system ATP-binding protein
VDKASEILRSFNIWDLRIEKVSTISFGDQRRLEIALSMASDPKVLLLDEPNCGLTAAENVELSKRISNLGKDIALVFIAHDMDLVFSVATRVMLLHYGELIIQGKPEDIKGNEMVKEIYLGKCKKI